MLTWLLLRWICVLVIHLRILLCTPHVVCYYVPVSPSCLGMCVFHKCGRTRLAEPDHCDFIFRTSLSMKQVVVALLLLVQALSVWKISGGRCI